MSDDKKISWREVAINFTVSTVGAIIALVIGTLIFSNIQHKEAKLEYALLDDARFNGNSNNFKVYDFKILNSGKTRVKNVIFCFSLENATINDYSLDINQAIRYSKDLTQPGVFKLEVQDLNPRDNFRISIMASGLKGALISPQISLRGDNTTGFPVSDKRGESLVGNLLIFIPSILVFIGLFLFRSRPFFTLKEITLSLAGDKKNVERSEAEKNILNPAEMIMPNTSEKEVPVSTDWRAFFIEGKYDQAVEALKRELINKETDEDKVWVEGWIGYCLIQLNFNDGLAYLLELPRKYPKQPGVYGRLAEAYGYRRLHKEALATVDKGLSNFPGDIKLILKKAEIFFELKQLNEGVSYLESMVKDIPEARLFTNLAEGYLKLKNYESAFLNFKKALKYNPDNEDALSKFAAALTENEQSEQALLVYKRLTALYPKNYSYHALLGNVYLKQDFYNAALNSYEEANKLAESKAGWVLANLGNLFNNKKLFDKAISFLNEAMKFDPNSEYIHKRLASTLESREAEKKKIDEVIDTNKGLYES